jgi:hypothetical protein
MPEVDPQRKKQLQEVIDRMSKGFDENMLDPLLEQIYNEPDGEAQPLPSESKVKYKKKKFQVIKVSSTGQGDTLAGFLGGKVKESFNMAADARRKDPNKIPKEKGHYLKKALKFQFGGDLVNRTKGTFSSDPTDVQDPALGKSGRFSAQVQPSYDIQQGPLQAPQGGSESNAELVAAADEVVSKIDEVSAAKDKGSEQLALAIEIQQDTNKQVQEVVTENNTLLKKSNIIKNRFLRFQSDQDESANVKKVEKRGEFAVDRASTVKVDDSREDPRDKEEEEKGGGGLLDTALDLLDGGSYFGKSASVGRRGAGRIVQRTALRLGGKKLAKTAAVKVTQSFIKKAALGLMRPLIKRIPLIGGLIDFAVSLMLGEPLGRAAAKAVGATLGGALGTLIPVPLAGTILGGFLGDMVGGAVYDALTGGSGGGDTKPKESDAGTSSPTAGLSGFEDEADTPQPDPYGPGPDINRPIEGPPEKLASGGVIAGEAGPESVFNLTSTVGRSTVKAVSDIGSSVSAVPFILGITQDIINSTPGIDMMKPFLSQYMGPLVRLFGVAKFSVKSILGKGATSSLTDPGDDKDLEAGGGGLGKGGAKPGETMTGAPANFNGDVDMGGGEGRTTAGAVYNYLLSKGLTENHAKGLVANISRESGFKLGAHGDKGIGGSFGLFQWNMAAGRGGPMMAAVPDWKTNWKGQIDYALQEFTGPDYLKQSFDSPGAAAHWWMANWEIPAARIQAQYTPAYYEGMIQKMGLTAGMSDTPPTPPNAPPTETPAGVDPVGAGGLQTPSNLDSADEHIGGGQQLSPPTDVLPGATVLPSTVAQAKKGGAVIVPIIMEGGNSGYVASTPRPMGSTERVFYTEKGQKVDGNYFKTQRLRTN